MRGGEGIRCAGESAGREKVTSQEEGEEENDITVDATKDEGDGDAGNYVAGNYIAEVCGNLRPRRGKDMARGQ